MNRRSQNTLASWQIMLHHDKDKEIVKNQNSWVPWRCCIRSPEFVLMFIIFWIAALRGFRAQVLAVLDFESFAWWKKIQQHGCWHSNGANSTAHMILSLWFDWISFHCESWCWSFMNHIAMMGREGWYAFDYSTLYTRAHRHTHTHQQYIKIYQASTHTHNSHSLKGRKVNPHQNSEDSLFYFLSFLILVGGYWKYHYHSLPDLSKNGEVSDDLDPPLRSGLVPMAKLGTSAEVQREGLGTLDFGKTCSQFMPIWINLIGLYHVISKNLFCNCLILFFQHQRFRSLLESFAGTGAAWYRQAPPRPPPSVILSSLFDQGGQSKTWKNLCVAMGRHMW